MDEQQIKNTIYNRQLFIDGINSYINDYLNRKKWEEVGYDRGEPRYRLSEEYDLGEVERSIGNQFLNDMLEGLDINTFQSYIREYDEKFKFYLPTNEFLDNLYDMLKIDLEYENEIQTITDKILVSCKAHFFDCIEAQDRINHYHNE